MSRKVIILDYGIGNVRSIANAVIKVGGNPVLTNQESEIVNADAVILPGVGAFQSGMNNLHNESLIASIQSYLTKGRPFMGICLGMQMLLDNSEEFGNTEGLGLIKGSVKRLPVTNEKLPHVSWNELIVPEGVNWQDSPLSGINMDDNFYFVHTFAAYPESPENILSFTGYGDVKFCSSVKKDNIYGFQFHPEKSGEAGLKILKNFMND